MLRKSLLLALGLSSAAHAADLTELETRWLTAAMPVLAYAQQLKLPIDIVVQPQAPAGAVPMAMGFDGARCKLVLSMRGNPDAEAQLAGVPVEQQGELIEAMAAHEMAHCWRYAQGVWHALPAGFVETGEETAPTPQLLAESKAMRETRREEGYADLVGVAWTRHRHPADYARVFTWLAALRQDQPVAHGGHDTRAWVRLAKDGARFGDAAAPFEDAAPLWREGLLSDN
jgi:ADP-ribose pyrophosphatase YjhB (NUDIX family)